MSCELLLGIRKSEASQAADVLRKGSFEETVGLLNGFPFSISELENMLRLNEPMRWYLASENMEPKLVIAYDIDKDLEGEFGCMLDFLCSRLSKLVVFFSDSGTNDFEMQESLPLETAKNAMKDQYGSGAPAKSVALIFESTR
jgi:hypothetical protein